MCSCLDSPKLFDDALEAVRKLLATNPKRKEDAATILNILFSFMENRKNFIQGEQFKKSVMDVKDIVSTKGLMENMGPEAKKLAIEMEKRWNQ